MSQARIWTGSSTFTSGSSTPFGIYDTDTTFQLDAPKVASWCATRLGYPIIDIELEKENFFAVFEEAVSEYSSQVNQFNIRNNLGSLEGQPTGTDYTHKSINGSELSNIITIAESYGNLANVGGRADIKRGSINIGTGSQEYDLQALWGTVSESGERIDVTTVFYESTPAINRFFDPYSVSGQGTLNLVDEFGFGSFSPAAQFVMMPIYEDMLRIQQIEFNDQIRKSAHTFNIVNNKIQIFPKPTSDYKLWFEYQVVKERRENAAIILPNVVSDYSNIGYNFANYSNINDVGKQWVRKYTLALAKEMLGAVREKYNTVPIPGSEVSLDGAALRAEAQSEKDFLIEQLRENLNEVSKKVRMENEAAMVDQQQTVMNKVPLAIFIG
jgi:hypothetical protein|tara:strand:+ start:1887 stop:3038 length:1152 start_codon:yes stop_codon:yes gene_type:complete